MSLAIGKRLGPYEVSALLGVGGMGEVYKATDTRLNRIVALKVLPDFVSGKPELKERFQREAQIIAALNHPHICVLHDVGSQEGVDFLVMEYLEGETLADRLTKGALSLDEVTRVGTQIADALEKAHRMGITHRDLKPSNIMLTRTGAKLMDFGLAKLAADNGPVALVSDSMPTMQPSVQPLTLQGTILGTLQYMAPEQMQGAEADARADIFSLGAVLFEMATGRRAFEGKSQVSVIAAVLEHDPPLISAVQPGSPPVLDEIVRICLAKKPEERWQNAADVLHALKVIAQYGTVPLSQPAVRSKRVLALWIAAILVTIAVSISSTWFWLARGVQQAARVSFELQTPSAPSPLHIALSPDGSHLVAVVNTETGQSLWLHAMDQLNGRVLTGSTGVQFPFWSPDSRLIAYFTPGKLNKIDIFGGPPQVLCDAANGAGGDWNHDGVIIFAPSSNGPLFKVPSGGGTPEQITELDRSRLEIAHRHPRFLPDGRHFLFVVVSSKAQNTGIYVGDLNSKQITRLVAADTRAAFAAPDHLLFMRNTTLMAQRFDPGRLTLTGDPFPVGTDVGINSNNSMAGFTVSDNGMLAYRVGGDNADQVIRWVDRDGKALGLEIQGAYSQPALSPDDQKLAIRRFDGQISGDIWILDLPGGTKSRFTFDPSNDHNPLWSPDGARIVFASNREGGIDNLYAKDAAGTGNEELLLKTDNNKIPTDWSRDGKFVLYTENNAKTGTDIWVLPLTGDKKPVPFLQTPSNEDQAHFSPDGRWILYRSNESGRNEIYVQSFPASGGKWQISTSSGINPRWRGDGREIFFTFGAGNSELAADIDTSSGSLKAGVPHKLFEVPFATMDSTKDGKRFILVQPQLEIGITVPPIRVSLNWASAAGK